MRKIITLVGACFLTLLVMAQNASLDYTNTPLKTIFASIEKQTGWTISYAQPIVDPNQKVSIHVQDVSVEHVLEMIFADKDISYRIEGTSVYLNAKTTPTQTNAPLMADGVVVDATGEPTIGATVMVKGTTNGTITDFNGAFNIEVKEGDVLLISYVGYQAQEVKAAKNLKVVLKEESELLEEVVVVGYGTQKRVNLTGAVSVIDEATLTNRPVATAALAIQGADPGLNLTVNSGSPDAGYSLNIRGMSSLTSGAEPLVLVDGVESSLSRVNANDIESISILKDASAAAVYGARASAGVVLITTKSGGDGKASVTYSGRVGMLQNTTSSDYITTGYESARIADLFNKAYNGSSYTNYTEEDYQQLYACINDKTENPSRPWVVTQSDGSYRYYANFDWYNYLYQKNRIQHEHNLSIQGGNDKVKYYVSGRYFYQDGILKVQNDDYRNASMRSKISTKINSWLRFTNNTSFFYSRRYFPGTSSIANFVKKSYVHALASVPATNPDGTAVYQNSCANSGTVTDGYSAILISGRHRNTNYDRDFKTTQRFDITPIKQLVISAEYSYSYRHREYNNRQTNVTYSDKEGSIKTLTTKDFADYYQEQHYRVNDHNLNIHATYEDTFQDLHHLKVMVGGQYENWESKNLKARQYDLATVELDAFDLATGNIEYLNGTINDWSTLGFFGRINYDYAGRYLFEFSARGDGSSRFAPGHRWGFFPSGSVGWRMSEEKWWKPIEKVWTNSKLRLSVGSLGNQSISDYYTYIEEISLGKSLDYLFDHNSTSVYSSESDPKSKDLTWETTTTYDLGLDLGFFRNRLNVSVDGYIRDTKNMLVDGMRLPATYGASSPKSNISDMRTTGWELSIGWADHVKACGKTLSYNVSFGIGDYTSKVTRYNNPSRVLDTDVTDGSDIYYEGQRVGELWGFVCDGLFLTNEDAASYPVDQSILNTRINGTGGGLKAGDMRFVDLDGDGVISRGAGTKDNPGDMKIIGNVLPRYSYNLKMGLTWYGVDFSAFFQGIGHQDWYPGEMAYGFWGPYSRPYVSFVPTKFMDNVWSEDNTNGYFPRARGYEALNNSSGTNSLGAVNTRYLQNIAYFRLKNLTVGYTIPLPQNKVVQNMRVYFSGENLFYFSPLKKYSKYVDPEQATSTNVSDSNTGMAYSFSRSLSLGLSVTF